MLGTERRSISRAITQLADAGLAERLPDGTWKVRGPRYEVGSKKRRQTFEQLALRDGSGCAYCGHILTVKTAHIDHVVPQSQGGSDHIDNKCLACPSCNSSKGGQTPEEWNS
ncbi:MAG: HNH endonuclease [Planctomycetota bacterium]